MKKKVIAFKNNEDLSIIIGGKHYMFQSERAKEIFEAAITYKADPTEENFKTLESTIAKINTVLHNDLIVEDGNGLFYLKGMEGIPMPSELAEMIIDYANNDYPLEAFINFWKLCAANPNAKARQGFFHYVKKFGVTITDNGYALLYKSVSRKRERATTDDMVNFISKEYMKIKKWKKAPKKYAVVETEEGYDIVDCYGKDTPAPDEVKGSIGDLQTLHDSLDILISESDVYYEPHYREGDYGNKIRLGEPVTMPRDKCDPNISNACSTGLHVGAHDYVKEFGFGGEERVLACLVNPMNIVALPKHDRSKIRCCEYYPYVVIAEGKDHWEEIESSYFEDDYLNYEKEEIEEILSNLKVSNKYTKDDVETDEHRRERLIEIYE